MPDPKQKLVKVDNDVISFPSTMGDKDISAAIKKHRSKGSKTGFEQEKTPTVPQSSPDSSVQSPQAINPILQQVLNEYPGLSKNFNANNTSLVFATEERAKRGAKERGGLEFWPPEGEPVAGGGDPTYQTPQLGKNVLEIYDQDLKNNPSALQAAITGDLLHGMKIDPYWNGLRDQFMQNFTPQELKRQNEAETWWDDVNGDRHAEQKGAIGHARGNGTYDAYIRGWLFNEGNGRQGQKEQGNTMYSPKQIQILKKMQEYLKTGKSQDQKKPTLKELLEEAKRRSPK